MAKILIIDDDETIPDLVRRPLQHQGYEVQISIDPDEGLARAEHESFDLVMIDLIWQMPGYNPTDKCFELLDRLHREQPLLPIIVISGAFSGESVLRERGAFDCLIKPFNDGHWRESVRKAATQTLLKEIGRVAARPVTVLLRGECGTSQWAAQQLHDHSNRKGGPFIAVDCSLPQSELALKLFGNDDGVLTRAEPPRPGAFQQAKGGTIVFYEIGRMCPSIQDRLRGVLEDRTIRLSRGSTADVRLIATTDCDLEFAVRNGRFRSDLYYRLNDVVIHLPPLRDRNDNPGK